MPNQKLNQLFEEWEGNIEVYKGKFVRDGIINEEEWEKASPKILYITKEPNQSGNQAAGDFRDDWNNGYSKYGFAYRIAEWSYGLLNDFPPFKSIVSDNTLYVKQLKKVAFLNIKKSGGIGTSEGPEIGRHFDLNESFLQRQLDIINPEIIVLCLSFNGYISSKMFNSCRWKDSGYDINVGKWNNSKIIDFYHPSSRNAPAASYSLLQNIYRSEVFKNL